MKALSVLLLAACCLFPQSSVDVGSGNIDPVIKQQFINGFFRNGFSNAVSLPPTGDVRKYGTVGLIQEFNDAAKSGAKLALVKPNTSTVSVQDVPDVFQMAALLYTYYTSVGVTTAGYPTMDTAGCFNLPAGSCYWQLFDKKYALFAYSAVLANGASTFATRDPYYTEWNANGGISTYGPATSAETAAVSKVSAAAATYQTFQTAQIFNITSGTLSGRLVSVKYPVFDLYTANGGATGFLGFPTGPEAIVGTKRRQTFEGGAIEYEPGQGAVLRLPVASINLSTAITSLQLKLNDTYTLQAIPRGANGDTLADRSISWVTTNGRVVSIQSNGLSATLKAVGGGVANVTAVSEGKISAPISVSVQAPCCQIGEGAPNATMAQAFADAVSRNRLTFQLPGANPVRRTGNGYTQEFLDAKGARYVLALADRSPQAWVMAGAILSRYEEFSGFTGVLGYPASDATVGGRQLFENGSLAGVPVQLVSGPILTRWSQLGYETGAAGPPVSPVSTFSTFAASGGLQQSFRDGVLLLLQTGANANRTYFVTGPILKRYQSLAGASGKLGSPTNEEFAISGKRRQDFEGGYLQYAVGSDVVELVESERKPTLSVLPASAVAGSRIRISAGGFADNSLLRVSATGEPDFNVQTRNGAYTWDVFIPPTAATRTIQLRAVDPSTNVAATASYVIRAATDAKPQLTLSRGNSQTAAPATLLPLPLRVNLRDESGNPLVGVAVVFVASPGAAVSPATVNTDINGDAETALRLPPTEGVALVTASAAGKIVTFSARAAGASIANFPRVTFDGNAYVASAAALLKFYQDRGELQLPSGAAATPAALDSYLRNFCTLDNQANQICDGYLKNPELPNLWRVPSFAGGSLEVLPLPATEAAVRESLAAGAPALLSLRLANGDPAAVVAIGVGANGEIQIMDPRVNGPKNSFSDYLADQATLAGAVRFSARTPLTSGFLFYAQASTIAIASTAGDCGAGFSIPFGSINTVFNYCDGAQPFYQAEVGASAAYKGVLLDLTAGGARYELNGLRQGSFRVSRPSTAWEVSPLEASFSATNVLNAASFGTDYAPGSAISIFGIGLGRSGATTTVEIGGQPAQVLFATPFQVNAVVPLDLAVGTWPLRISSLYGTAEALVDVRAAAPALFRLSANQAAITNQDNSLNAPNNPAARGQVVVVYGTGFGAVTGTAGGLRPISQPVTARVGGVDLPIVYAGLTPGAIGLYQLNLRLPVDMPPGLFQSLEIRQGGVSANPAPLAIR